jgi:hypothetical protein
MTEFNLQNVLFSKFLELNDFCGIEFITKNEDGEVKNVHFPNTPFEIPDDKSWFELTVRTNPPTQVAVMENSQVRITGIFYIDIMTPSDVGEHEAENKYKWICRLFNNARFIDDVVINNCSLERKENELGYYRLLCAIEFEADIDKEM